MYNDWIKIIVKLVKKNYLTENIICPECGQKSINYVYVGNPISHIGYLPIWCTNCNKGIQISRVEIPKGVKMIEFDNWDEINKNIPNFEHIIPD
ncbi:MAG: hypothetical protein J6K43_03380 [Lachnospiraceae bacterium]|nr:hypothetical protein [Lachnospiraceae bacterium]